jgi:hypothetical protein
MSKMIQSNPGFVITDSMVTAFGKLNAKVYSMVGQNSNIPEPEKTIFILLATKKCRLTIELVSPTSRLAVNRLIHAALVRTFQYSEELMK